MRQTWLIIGHGSVGSSLVNRLLVGDNKAYIYDPRPRIDLPRSDLVAPMTGEPMDELDYVALCVPTTASIAAAGYIRDAVARSAPVFDWTSALPATKQECAAMVSRPWIDVALLDSLDKENDGALLAISGEDAARHGEALAALSFEVLVVGSEVGQAAQVKLVRSLFMKGLEALVIEARAIAGRLDPNGTAWRSIERNLGDPFAEFADLLVASDATHAARRCVEIGEAVGFARSQGLEPLIGVAAEEVLSRLGVLWEDTSSKIDQTDLDLLLQHALGVFTNGSAGATTLEGGRGQ